MTILRLLTPNHKYWTLQRTLCLDLDSRYQRQAMLMWVKTVYRTQFQRRWTKGQRWEILLRI
ncbi:hypothetical protein FQN60_010290 [Etheostoma spectabile]|uniref:Uncharacterized protein n=1 Tax=Etheostoma spectabile TaxID=54343 RepID=A0A5J5D8P8_9PERO|nr:hypothetical protein FQN60_010290 [Etheostoma spectabile]